MASKDPNSLSSRIQATWYDNGRSAPLMHKGYRKVSIAWLPYMLDKIRHVESGHVVLFANVARREQWLATTYGEHFRRYRRRHKVSVSEGL